jgi:hypothetical protein
MDLVETLMQKQNLESESADFAVQYLSHFFHNPEEGEFTADKIDAYVRDFQSMTGMEVNGQLTPNVVKAMKFLPRCGCKDYTPISAQAGGARSWGLKEITYYVEKWVNGIPDSDQATLLQMAFDAWSTHADIRAKRVSSSSNANIIVSAGRGARDDFDGPSNTLAWAYLPPQPNYRGQLTMKFDLDETWIVRAADRGILYLNVATHEIGHLLGLDHSKISRALMAPYYAVSIVKPQPNDDVPRIVNLYGQATQPPPPPSGGGTPTGKVTVTIVCDPKEIRINNKPVGVSEAEPDFDLI